MEKIKYNELPVITFRWLKANHLDLIPNVMEAKNAYVGDYILSGKEAVKTINSIPEIEKWMGNFKGANEVELKKNLENAGNVHFIESGISEDTVRLSYVADEKNSHIVERNHILVKKGETLRVILEYSGDDAVEVSTMNLIEVEEDGKLELIKINHLGNEVRHIDQRYTRVESKGTFSFISVDLGGKETIVNYVNDLLGDEADGNLKSIYLVKGTSILDLSHIMNHFGQRCTSDMDLRGALSDKARKYFRGTLDFKKGSAQSEGGEIETVTLLDPTVRSYAIPLLLCGEHDVIGNHAASAGQIDEEKLFYLMSRGFSKAESRKIIVESSFRPIIDEIPMEDIKEDILNKLEEMLKKVD